jgi:hypothetical protein
VLYGQLSRLDFFASVAPRQSLPVGVADSPQAGLLIVAEPPVVKSADEMEAARLTAGGTTQPAVRYQLPDAGPVVTRARW